MSLADLTAVRDGDLVAWASECEERAWTRDDLLRHHAIVERIFAATPACLPARFGTRLSAELLHARHAELQAALERVTDRAELAVTAVWTAPASPAHTGTEYLRGRAGRLEAARRLARDIERACGADLVAAEHREIPSDSVALSSALLVARDRVMTAKQTLPRQMSSVRILVNGPWPPYTFAALGSTREE